ncbi:hypothetical protein [Ensifer soli]|uniref:hypothetical protein n=1 Tax=Ciceribacter sp. sgz301302 TaxID=3342379 RepID=UPI0035B9E85D
MKPPVACPKKESASACPANTGSPAKLYFSVLTDCPDVKSDPDLTGNALLFYFAAVSDAEAIPLRLEIL